MKSFEVIHHQRVIRILNGTQPVEIRFEADAWERLIKELNNPPDIGIEASEGTTVSEEISGS